MATLNLKKIKKSYGGVDVVHGIDLEVKDNEFIVLVGPSGCGKSTTLRMIAGLEEITDGSLYIGSNLVNELPPSERSIAMIFQDYALYPHMTVYENMAFGLKIKKLNQIEIDRRITEAAKMLDLDPYLERKPAALSGGQRQRVAMGRAIVKNAQVFLFDEPLSNLDAKLRSRMRSEIKKFHRDHTATIIYVTHDQLEAMTLADRLVVMNDGKIEQVGTPLEVFERPRTAFVAGFIGSPQMNLVVMDCEKKAGKMIISSKDKVTILEIPEKKAELLANYKHGEILFGLRPSDFFIVDRKDKNFEGWVQKAKISLVEGLGKNAFITFQIGDQEWIGEVEGRDLPLVGSEVYVGMNLYYAHFFDIIKSTNLCYGPLGRL